MTSDIVTGALTMAWFRSRPTTGALNHSDQGSKSEFNRLSNTFNQGGIYGTTSRLDADIRANKFWTHR